MNSKIIALADAIARIFDEQITKGTEGKEVLLIPTAPDSDFRVPDRKMDKDGWEEFSNALKFRHKLEAHSAMGKEEIYIWPYGHLSEAPLLDEAMIDQTIAAYKVAEEETAVLYAALIARLQTKEK